MNIISLVVQIVVYIFLFTVVFSYEARLSKHEVEILKQVGEKLGKTDWNFSADPCSQQWGWATPNAAEGLENAVTCNCSFANNTICHVVSIVLKAQNLPGILPQELINLPQLQEIDLSRNYLNGTIPPEWGSMKLIKVSLMGNRLTGTIPKEFGDLSSLTDLVLDYNQLSGEIPPELGSLPKINRLLLSSNYFTGNLPVSLANLNSLKDFRIGDNQFSGKIPNYIQNWTNLEKLVIQGSGLNGPIPSGISLLMKLTDIRISDLQGSGSTFPPISNIKNLKTLILRSCNISGQLPGYVGTMTKLKTLDLSFNHLVGPIPVSFSGLSKTDNMYLTGNMLSGSLPDWMSQGDDIDLSYNNLTIGSADSSSCQQKRINLFASSSGSNNPSNVSCISSECQKRWHSLHINCGGNAVNVDGKIRYEDDLDSGGSSRFFQSRTNWAFSSTGHFLDDDRPRDFYIATNTSRLYTNNPELYTNARLSPISLTYYAFCMLNGNYTVKLHFAEIMFTDDRTYSSLGRRIFDIYIQGKLVAKDFNIEEEAGGVGNEIIKFFTAVVADNTLEIRFYYAGKGTTGLPSRGVYGPLISAISVDPDFIPPSENRSISISGVVGIIIAAVVMVSLALLALWRKGCFTRKGTTELDMKGLDLQTSSFTLRQIKAATKNFDPAKKIGEGGFGSVYRGLLPDGTMIAVKQLSSKSRQGNREFINEIGMISALQHPHLVKLYGCCIEGNQLLLVYEYMENNSLARALFGPKELVPKLNWSTRYKICIGIARGLAYLHEESRLKIVHRDIKATNVLLDKNLNAKISDFGLAKLDDEENTHISTRIAGTYGYMAPEYAMRGYLTDKADVYSFGIVALEIVTGKANNSFLPKENSNLLDSVLILKEKGDLMELVDPRLGSNYNPTEVMVMINVALRCTNISPVVRPSMSTVVSILEGRIVETTNAEELNWPNNGTTSTNGSQKYQSISIDERWSDSSSANDLYPLDIESKYLKNRD